MTAIVIYRTTMTGVDTRRPLLSAWSARALVGLALLATIGGCALPSQFRVRAGTDPNHVDEDVRFRTTYYFRVFDYCESLQNDPERTGAIPPRIIFSDSLYRFRMTGKASSLASKVKFESGTLRAGEIDPFGADVEFDTTAGRFRFRSKGRTNEETTLNQVKSDVAALIDIERNALGQDAATVTGRKTVLQNKVTILLDERLERLKVQSVEDSAGTQKTGSTEPDHEIAAPAMCKEPLRRGFQIFGPEGWRTFDQDERLLIAMSSSGSPLVETMHEVSSRILQQGNRDAPSATALLSEYVRVRDAQQLLSVPIEEKSGDAGRIVNEIEKRFEKEGPQ